MVASTSPECLVHSLQALVNYLRSAFLRRLGFLCQPKARHSRTLATYTQKRTRIEGWVGQVQEATLVRAHRVFTMQIRYPKAYSTRCSQPSLRSMSTMGYSFMARKYRNIS